MGRPRKLVDAERPLPPGLYLHGRQFRALDRSRKWISFGEHYPEALKAFGAWREAGNAGGARGTIGALLDDFVERECRRRVAARRLAERTARDYRRDRVILKKGLGHFRIEQLRPTDIGIFRDAREVDAPAHVRNELACLSAALQWAVDRGLLDANPAREVKRAARDKRMRLITHDEYLAVYLVATEPVKLAMTLAVRTLGLPGDILELGPRHLVRGAKGERLLRFQRGKTKIPVEVLVEGELATLIDAHLAERVVRATFVSKVRPKHAGKQYTVDGIGSMFRRYCATAGISDFGIRDLRAKGATDMHRAGVPLQEIQLLLGHASVRTTEIYIKSLLPGIARPNATAIIAST